MNNALKDTNSKPHLQRRDLFWGAAATLGVAAAGFGTWLASKGLQSEVANADIIAALSEAELLTLDGKTRTLMPLLGRLSIINFWATWCPPCVAEMPLLNRIFLENAAKDVQIIGIAVDKAEPVAQFIHQKSIQFPVLIAGAGGVALSKQFGNKIGALPYSVLVNKSGEVLGQKTGEISEEEAVLWLNGF